MDAQRELELATELFLMSPRESKPEDDAAVIITHKEACLLHMQNILLETAMVDTVNSFEDDDPRKLVAKLIQSEAITTNNAFWAKVCAAVENQVLNVRREG